jgi:hypothetical protein
MGHVCNLSPSHRPPQPSLNNGPVQRRVRRAFVATGQSVLSTTQIMDWSHPRPGTNRHHARLQTYQKTSPEIRSAEQQPGQYIEGQFFEPHQNVARANSCELDMRAEPELEEQGICSHGVTDCGCRSGAVQLTRVFETD